MNDFLSNGDYLSIPSQSNPRVQLNVSSHDIAKNSFKLYNPFSLKAKVLKALLKILVLKFNAPAKYLLCQKVTSKGPFTKHLEEHYQENIITSIYHSTTPDTITIQIQSEKTGLILSIAKFPLNKKGAQAILNETQGAALFHKAGLLQSEHADYQFHEERYLLLKPIDGHSNFISNKEIETMLGKLKSNETYLLTNHPRVLALIKSLKEYQLDHLAKHLNSLNSKDKHCVAIEHGDFTPWNTIVDHDGQPHLIDFEFAVEVGLENLDIIKYYFQVGRLLNHFESIKLYEFLEKNISIENLHDFVLIFIIKEIVEKQKAKLPHQFENHFLKFLTNE